MVINMWWFYLIDVLDKFGGFAMFVSIAGAFVLAIAPFIASDAMLSKEDGKAFWKSYKKGIIAWVVSVLALVAIPSKDTMYAMLVAQNVTYENVELAGNVVTDVVDYIIDAVDQLNDSGGE